MLVSSHVLKAQDRSLMKRCVALAMPYVPGSCSKPLEASGCRGRHLVHAFALVAGAAVGAACRRRRKEGQITGTKLPPMFP